MKRPATHRSPNEAALPSTAIIAVAVELSQLCTSAAQLHNAIGNQYYHDHPSDDIPPSSSTLPSEEAVGADVFEQAPATQAMQHYQLASEMLLLAEEYREPTSSACAALFDTTSANTSAEDNDTTIGLNAETSLNFLIDYIADLEKEYNRCVLMTASATFGSMSQGTPLSFTMSTPPNEQAAAVFYNMSLVCVLLGNEDRAVDFLSMVEELCHESSSCSPAPKSCQDGEEIKATPNNSRTQDRRADVELLALSVVSSAKVSSSSSLKTKPGTAMRSTKLKLVDTSTLLQVGKSHAIRSKNFVAEGSADSDPSSSACSVPTVLPSYNKFSVLGGSLNPADADFDGLAGDGADEDCLSQSSEPW